MHNFTINQSFKNVIRQHHLKEHYWTKKLSDKEYIIPTVSNKEHYRKEKSSDKESYLTKKTKRKLSKK